MRLLFGDHRDSAISFAAAILLIVSSPLLPGALSDHSLHAQEFRSMDGSNNSLSSPFMGSSGMPLLREVAADYSDGVSSPAGASRPSPRLISNLVCAQTTSIPNSVDASDFVWQWGQFLDHDIDLSNTLSGSDPLDQMPIQVPTGDIFFDPNSTGTQTIPLTRSAFVAGSNPRAQVNSITAWIDASNIYGSDGPRALALRTLDGTGRLRTSPGNLLPFNVGGAFPNAQIGGLDPGLFFLSGDVRANEQVGLTAMHTLFMREHNRLVDELAIANPTFGGDELYLRARRIVGAQLQRITFAEFLPVLLGPSEIPPYSGYNSNVDSSIRNLFSTACYRLGHSMLSPTLLRLSAAGLEIPQGHLPLAAAFFSPDAVIQDGGIEPILRGLAAQRAQELDPLVVDAVRNFLFGPPGAGGFDLASLNIQRGRDHGLPSYNDTRVALGLSPKTSFAEISSDTTVQQSLQDAYGSVAAIDLWVGGLAENHVAGSMLGELLQTVLILQFTALRDGDRMWYENEMSSQEIAEINATTLKDVIVRNTTVGQLQDNVFLVGTPAFVRADCDTDSDIDIADSIVLLNLLFLGSSDVPCPNACDANSDGTLSLVDPIYSLIYLFLQGAPPPPPFPTCAATAQTIDELPCYSVQACP